MVLVCMDCSTRYAPDLEQCPHCGSAAGVGEDEVQQRARPLLPVRVVACGTETCPVRGLSRRVVSRHAAPGVLEQPALVCARCGGEMQPVDNDEGDDEEEEESMPKVTVHGGPSNADDPDQPAEQPAGDEPGQAEQPAEQPTPEGGESEEPAAPTAQDYNDWTVDQLRAELAERGLSTTGKKADLQQRLADG